MKCLWYWDATLQYMVCSFAAFGTKVLLCNSGGAAFPCLLSQGAPLQYLQYQILLCNTGAVAFQHLYSQDAAL